MRGGCKVWRAPRYRFDTVGVAGSIPAGRTKPFILLKASPARRRPVGEDGDHDLGGARRAAEGELQIGGRELQRCVSLGRQARSTAQLQGRAAPLLDEDCARLAAERALLDS